MIASADIKSIIADVERLPGKHVIYKLRSGQHTAEGPKTLCAKYFGGFFW